MLIALLVVADRSAASYAGRALADELQRTGTLAATPSVDVGGFPFLLQAVRGRYDRIEVTAVGVPAGEVTLAQLDAVLTGVQVPLVDVVSGQVGAVPVGRVQARALLSYADLARRSGNRGLRVEPVGNMVRVTGSVVVFGRTLEASAVSRVVLEGTDVVVTATSYEVGNAVADAALTRALGDRLDFRVPLRGLPYGLVVDGVTVTAAGVVVSAGARDTVLSQP